MIKDLELLFMMLFMMKYSSQLGYISVRVMDVSIGLGPGGTGNFHFISF